MRSTKKQFSFWSYRAKIFSLVAILTVAVSGFTIANYAMNHYYSFKSHAANGNAEIFFEPSAVSVGSLATAAINAWVMVDQPVDTIEVAYSFDPSKVYLTAEPLFANSAFKYQLNNMTLAEVNKTGQGMITLSMSPLPVPTTVTQDKPGVLGVQSAAAPSSSTPTPRPSPIVSKEPVPSPSPTPTPPSVLPTGTLRLATFSLKAVKPVVETSYLAMDGKSARIMGSDKVLFSVQAKSSSLYLNSPVPSFVPSPIASPKISPYPVPSVPVGTCISTVKNVAYAVSSTSACKTGAEYANYVCLDGYSGSLGDGTTCTSTAEFDALAKSRCGSPHPCPSLKPSPSPSSSSSLFSCKVRVFKLKSTDPIGDPTQYATPDREVVSGSNRVSPGDRYAYLIEAMANNFTATVATISATSNNVHGFNEPIAIKSTTPYCKPESSVLKYLSCVYPQTTIYANAPLLTKMGMMVEIQKEVNTLYNTSTTFHVNFLYSGAYHSADCGVIMLAANPTTNSPTPTPTLSCAKQLGSWTYRTSCSTINNLGITTRGYRDLDFKCQGENITRTIDSTKACVSTQTLISRAKNVCLKLPCPSITPTATPLPTIVPRPTPTCYTFFGKSICLN